MYNYSDIARANLTAGNIITGIKAHILAFSKDYSDNLELMKKLAISDNLEDYWRHGRYLSFMRTLYTLHDICINSFDTPSDLANRMNVALDEMIQHEDVLFEYMSSRSDASFNETANLFKWAKLKAEILSSRYDSVWSKFSSWAERYEDISVFSFEQKGLLTEMVSAINFADALLEYEKENAGPEIDELHATLKEIGAFDRWRKF